MLSQTLPRVLAKPIAFVALASALAACSNTSGTTNTKQGTTAIECINSSSTGQLDCSAKTKIVYDNTSASVANGSTIPVSVATTTTPTADDNNFTFTISNAGSSTAAAELRIAKMELQYQPASPLEDASTGDLAFTCLDSTKTESCATHVFKAIVPSGFEDAANNRVTAEHFIIHFKQFDTNNRSAKLLITFVNDLDLNSKTAGVFTINLATKLGVPKIVISPTEVAWGYVQPDTQAHQAFTISNQGDGVLICKSFLFTASAPIFTIDALGGLTNIPSSSNKVDLPSPVTVAVAGSQDVGVSVSPTDDKPQNATLTLFCNDPSQLNGMQVPIKANSQVPCLKLDPTNVNFGGVLAAGGEATNPVKVTSCGDAQLCITSFAFAADTGSPGEFAMDFTPMQALCPGIDPVNGPTTDKPCCIPANGKSTSFNVKYTPSDVSPADPNNPGQQVPDTVNIIVSSNAFSNPPPTVIVSGTGVLQTCPIAKIEVTEGDEVIPQTTLHLKGDGSKGAGGQAIKTYKWTAKQPAGSAKGFAPSATFPNPTFVPDAAGEYEFCLDVVDVNGVKSCAQTCQKVLVVPNNAVHVELLWDTPADPDQTDTGPGAGADEDLHFANYLASGPDLDCDGTGDPWFNNPFDCFWFNNSPQWGSVNPAIKDDPTLDLDDTDGAGPENLNLEHPEGDASLPRWYAIGVHYWNDHGYGVSYSTINVYLFGAVALHVDKVLQNPLDMWYVGKLNWPNQLTGTNTPPLTVCYQTAGSKPGDVCADAANPGKPNPVKMWQPKGEWCITPCYVNPTFAATTGGATPSNCKNIP